MDLENLFRWKGELTIKDRNGEPVIVRKRPLVLFQRIIGDADLVKARKEALKASRTLRRTLRDETSDNAIAMLPDYKTMDKEALKNMTTVAEALILRRQAANLVPAAKEIKPPGSNATLEQQEEYEAALEKSSEDYTKAINEKLQELMELRLKELSEMNRDHLAKTFLGATIDSLCQAEMLNVFNNWCTYLGTYSDKAMTKRAFKSYQTFDNSATELKDQVIRGYLMLEMGGEDLKN